MIRLYGVEKGNASWPRVTDGVRQGLEASGVLSGFYDVQSVDLDYDNDGDALQVGFDAPIGLCIGAPTSATVMMGRGMHRERLLMVATNSSWLPETLMERAVKVCTGFVAPSDWSATVIEKYAQGLPVYVFPHGVDPGFKPVPVDPLAVSGVLHMASTHMQRKGTCELIDAWAQAKRMGWVPHEAKLRMIVDGPRGYFTEAIGGVAKGNIDIAESYVLEMRHNLSVEKMCKLYVSHDFVCQPSRGEGFGMVPLEARACGVPVIATACTGHAQHMRSHNDRGVVVIPHGPDMPVDDGPGAMAPEVSAFDIAESLGYAYSNRNMLRLAAMRASGITRELWSWEVVTRDFLSANADLFEA